MRLLIISFLVAGCFGCESTDSNPEKAPSKTATFVFGEAYGFCAGDCAHFYKLKNNQLFKDKIERFNGTVPDFDPNKLSDDKWEVAKSLISELPDYLLNNPDTTLGCPDCADQGGVYLFYQNENKSLYWNIDTAADRQPPEIRNYILKVRSIIDQLED